MDKRILRSQTKLTSTLLTLLSEKNVNDITVLELCQKANINRTTFYKYYKDIPDLVNKTEENLILDLKKELPNIKRNYLISFSNIIIETINDNKEIYSKLLGENGDHLFLKKILASIHNESILEWQRLLKKAKPEDLEKIYNFIVDGIIGIINNWIGNNYQDEHTTISIFINKICMSGLSSFV